jgi:hypothetical protein
VVTASAEKMATALVFGTSPDISASIADAFARHDVAVRRAQVPRGSPRLRWRGDALIDSTDDAVDTVILVLDEHTIGSLFDGRPSGPSRRRLREYGDEVCDFAVDTALSWGARRFLTVCDARRLTFGRRVRAVRWVRDLARSIGYEGSINGPHPLATSYALIETDVDIDRIAGAAANGTGGVRI